MRPRSFRLSPKNSELYTFRGKFCAKLVTSIPSSWFKAEATSKSVVVTGSVFMMFPFDVWNLRRVSVYAEAGLEETGPAIVDIEGAAG